MTTSITGIRAFRQKVLHAELKDRIQVKPSDERDFGPVRGCPKLSNSFLLLMPFERDV
jgi:hypothetical protein